MTTPWLLPLVAYVVGSLPFAYFVARRWSGVDVRQAGSGNVGATNVARTVGLAAGAIVLVLDVAKGAIVMQIARDPRIAGDLPEAVVALTGLAAIVGHVYPVWLGFRGGKGVATACGVFALLAPRAWFVSVAAFAIIVGATRYVSLASIVAAVMLPCGALVMGEPRADVLAACGAALIIVFRHRENVARLLTGAEPRLGQHAPRPHVHESHANDHGPGSRELGNGAGGASRAHRP